MTALTSVMLGTRDADRLHAWYTTVLTPDTDDRMGDYRVLGWTNRVYLFIDPRDDVEAAHPDPARTILNLEVDDARAVAARVEEAGGTWVAPLEDLDGSLFATVQDPDGNYVQVIQLGDPVLRWDARAHGPRRGDGADQHPARPPARAGLPQGGPPAGHLHGPELPGRRRRGRGPRAG